MIQLVFVICEVMKMAVITYRVNEDYNASNHMEFICDTSDDIKSLPGLDECAAGSTALLRSGDLYFLTSDGKWELLFAGEGGA